MWMEPLLRHPTPQSTPLLSGQRQKCPATATVVTPTPSCKPSFGGICSIVDLEHSVDCIREAGNILLFFLRRSTAHWEPEDRKKMKAKKNRYVLYYINIPFLSSLLFCPYLTTMTHNGKPGRQRNRFFRGQLLIARPTLSPHVETFEKMDR